MGFKHGAKEFLHDMPAPVYVIWATIVMMAVIGLVASVAEASTPTPRPTDHACFKASDWGPASDTIRPCVSLQGNAPEGGAVRFAVKDASGVTRYTGFVNTTFRVIVHVRIIRLYEDGSFTWKVRGQHGGVVIASVGNLQD